MTAVRRRAALDSLWAFCHNFLFNTRGRQRAWEYGHRPVKNENSNAN